MSRWLLALLFAFGTVTFLTGCPAEEEAGDDAVDVDVDVDAPDVDVDADAPAAPDAE